MHLADIDLTDLERFTSGFPHEMCIVFEALLDCFDEVALAGPIEWTRSNKHTGVRHMPVSLRPIKGRPWP